MKMIMVKQDIKRKVQVKSRKAKKKRATRVPQRNLKQAQKKRKVRVKKDQLKVKETQKIRRGIIAKKKRNLQRRK